MNEAKRRAGKAPKTMITDKLAAYLDGIELVFGADTKHIRSKPFTIENNTKALVYLGNHRGKHVVHQDY